jgi:5'-3' exonuclease
MGIKYFFSWFNNNFSQTISHDKKSVDCLLMDLNGIFHSAAQQAFEYGNFKGIKPLLNRKKESYNSKKTKFFNLVTSKIDQVITSVQPRTEVVLCIDGVAPMSKQNQQRQRRYKSSLQRPDSFDPNGITPGTKLMDHLSKYIDFWLRDKITNDMYYSNLKFTFSN